MRTQDALRVWARGWYPTEAAVELLAHAFDGRFARADQPWIVTEPGGRCWVDTDQLAQHLGSKSGGEQRVLRLAMALIDPDGAPRLDIVDTVTGIDRDNLDLVLAALAHTAGSHQDCELVRDHDAGTARLIRSGPLHDWPASAPPASSTPPSAPDSRTPGNAPKV